MKHFASRVFEVFGLNPQLRYLSSTAQIEEATPSVFPRAILWILSLGVLACLAVFNFAKINEIAQAKGIVEPLGLERNIRHPTGGVVVEIHAMEGQQVEEGDPIVTLHDADLASDLSRANERLRALRTNVATERAYLSQNIGALSHLPKADQAQAVATNVVRQEALKDQLSIVSAQKQQREEELVILAAQQTRLSRQLASSLSNLEKRRALFEKGHISQDRIEVFEQDHKDLTSELDIVRTRIKRAQSSYSEFNDRLSAVTSNDTALTRETINSMSAELNEALELVTKLLQKQEALIVRATTNGRLKGMEIASIGGLVTPVSTITKIVPSDERLVINVRIGPSDIGRLSLGGLAQLRFDAFDAERFGLIDGFIERISAASFVGEGGSLYYTAQISPSQMAFETPDRNYEIQAGMSVDAQIILGQRTVMAYLLSPVYRALSSAMTES